MKKVSAISTQLVLRTMIGRRKSHVFNFSIYSFSILFLLRKKDKVGRDWVATNQRLVTTGRKVGRQQPCDFLRPDCSDQLTTVCLLMASFGASLALANRTLQGSMCDKKFANHVLFSQVGGVLPC